jgi:nucleoid DNA-binding protein
MLASGMHGPDGYGILDAPSRLSSEDADFIRSLGLPMHSLPKTESKQEAPSQKVVASRFATTAGITKKRAESSVEQWKRIVATELKKDTSLKFAESGAFRFPDIVERMERSPRCAARFADKFGISKKEAKSSLEELTGCIVRLLREKRTLRLAGLGTFRMEAKGETSTQPLRILLWPSPQVGRINK